VIVCNKIMRNYAVRFHCFLVGLNKSVILTFYTLLFYPFSFMCNADDATLTSESQDDLQRMLHTFKIRAEK
jgi:hypothetical protein